MKRKIGIAAAIILALFVVTGCQKQEETPKKSEQKKTEASEELLSGTHHAEIQVKDYGTITVELDADTAPITVTNFVNLAKDGFYDNLTFHRIMDGFMIQGGDPNGDGTGGADQTIKGEFSSNGSLIQEERFLWPERRIRTAQVHSFLLFRRTVTIWMGIMQRLGM